MLRLWVASADYTQDMRISKDIMKQLSQAYLKIRNTARYMLGNLCDFEPDRDLVPAENLMELDRYALHTFNELAKTARAAYDRYEFHAVYRAVYNFCVVDMSNFYLDIIKDRLYCGAEAERRSAQTALYHILDGMTRLIAPILAFTSDEIWHAMKHAQGVNAESVLFNDMPGDNAAFALDAAAKDRWAKLVSLRDAVNKALENARNAGVLKKAQDTDVTLSVSESDAAFLAGVDLASLCIVSKVTVTTGAVEGEKSEDCLIPCTIAVALDESPKCPAAGTTASTSAPTATTTSCATAAPPWWVSNPADGTDRTPQHCGVLFLSCPEPVFAVPHRRAGRLAAAQTL